MGFPGGASGKELPANAREEETWVWSLGWEDPLEEGMATHSSILAWRIPWTEEPGGLQSLGSQRIGHDWSELACTHKAINTMESDYSPHEHGFLFKLNRGLIILWRNNFCNNLKILFFPNPASVPSLIKHALLLLPIHRRLPAFCIVNQMTQHFPWLHGNCLLPSAVTQLLCALPSLPSTPDHFKCINMQVYSSCF